MTDVASVAELCDIDPQIYISTLISIAVADGKTQEKERAYVETQAQLFSVDTTGLWEQQDRDMSFLDGLQASRTTRLLIIRDCIALGHVEGDFNELEREEVALIASKLGLSQRDVESVELWLKDLWAILKRAEQLFANE